MQKPARPMTTQSMRSATLMSSQRVESTLKLADALRADAKRDERLASQRCKACFYYPGMGGAAITSQPCMCCGVDQSYSSTNTSAMCTPCAKDGQMCRHCGGDIEMDMRRGVWPKAYGGDGQVG